MPVSETTDLTDLMMPCRVAGTAAAEDRLVSPETQAVGLKGAHSLDTTGRKMVVILINFAYSSGLSEDRLL